MKTFIFFFLIVSVSVAKDGDVYVFTSREYNSVNRVAKPQPRSPFTFDYHWGDVLSMNIYLTKLVPNVTANMYLKYLSGDIMQRKELREKEQDKQFQIQHYLDCSKILIELELSTTAGLCTTHIIVNATEVIWVEPQRRHDTLYNDICLKEEPCVIEVDLLNNNCEVFSEPDGLADESFKPSDETAARTHARISTESDTVSSEPDGPADELVKPSDETATTANGIDTESKHQPKLKAVLTYVIPSVIGMGVIILVIYLSVKKYCHRNSHPVEATELNTHATANEVVYADLSLVQVDSQPPKHDEESKYAKIIGVMRPVPR